MEVKDIRAIGRTAALKLPPEALGMPIVVAWDFANSAMAC